MMTKLIRTYFDQLSCINKIYEKHVDDITCYIIQYMRICLSIFYIILNTCILNNYIEKNAQSPKILG